MYPRKVVNDEKDKELKNKLDFFQKIASSAYLVVENPLNYFLQLSVQIFSVNYTIYR